MRIILPSRFRQIGSGAITCVLLLASCSGSTNGSELLGATAPEAPAATSPEPISGSAEANDPSPTSTVLAAIGNIAETARTLSAPIRECVVREDTSHPVFHGCIDWHSAVHGNYALRAISRLTGDDTFVTVADSVVSPDGLEREFASITSGSLREELPYGLSWFLILDREAASPEMAPLADAISTQVRQWIEGHLDGDEVSAPAYQNLSFAVLALHRWYLRVAPEEAAELRQLVIPALVARSGDVCSREAHRNDEFFDPCANLLLALSDADITEEDVVDDDVLETMFDVVTRQPPLPPEEIATVHAAGLNFSRSWAIYVGALALGQPEAVAVGDRYFATHFAAEELWRENYRSYGHWVAQFGIHALDLREQAQKGLPITP